MSVAKEFPTLDVLSTITGRLMAGIGGVYEVLNWMTGESVYTHQIPRIGREATPVLIAAHPLLADAVAEVDQVDPSNYRQWFAPWLDRYGPVISVPKFNADDHESIDPLSALAEHVHPDKIVVIDHDR